jgi:hypothetical protein
MKYKPDESTLIAYLYGELDATENEKVAAYLAENAEGRVRLEHLAQVRTILSQIRDKEVIAPPVFTDGGAGHVHFWQTGLFRTGMSIAAAIVLILVAGRLIGPEISYSGGELRISFNKAATREKPEGLTPAQVQHMINRSLTANNQQLQTGWDDNQRKLEKTLQQNFAANTGRINELMNSVSQATQDQVRLFVAGLQEDNLKRMKDYLQLSAKEQNAYVEALLVDFSKYLQEQRKQDIQLFQTRMTAIENNTDQFKQETEQILASIISSPESNIKRINNY